MFIWVIFTGVLFMFYLSLQIHVLLCPMLSSTQEAQLDGSHLSLFCSLTCNFLHQCRVPGDYRNGGSQDQSNYPILEIPPEAGPVPQLQVAAFVRQLLPQSPVCLRALENVPSSCLFKPVSGNYPVLFLARGHWTIPCTFYLLCSHLL